MPSTVAHEFAQLQEHVAYVVRKQYQRANAHKVHGPAEGEKPDGHNVMNGLNTQTECLDATLPTYHLPEIASADVEDTCQQQRVVEARLYHVVPPKRGR